MNAGFNPEKYASMQQVCTRNGIAYRKIGCGPNLVLMHGSAGSWRHWTGNIDALSQIRTVIALDLPGYGDSVGVEPDISLDSYCDRVTEAVVEICGDNGSVDLVGFSFGGQIAAGTAVRLGDRARRLALLTPSGFPEPIGRELVLPRRKDFDRSETGFRTFHRTLLTTMMMADPKSADDAAVDIQSGDARRARFNGKAISWSGRMPALLADVRCPILLVYGAEDPMPYPSISARVALCRKVRPDIEVAVIPKASHWLQYERAGETNDLIAAFLEKPV